MKFNFLKGRAKHFETRPSNGFVFCKVDGLIYEAYDGMELFEIETEVSDE